MADDSEQAFTHLRITVPFPCKGRFNGIDYVWKKGGESLVVPIGAAQHCFGFGLDDKSLAFHRIGWISTVATMEDALAKLEQCSFMPLKQVYEIAPSAPKRGRPRISNARSLVNAGGTKGPAAETPHPAPDDQDDEDDEDDDVSAEAI